jgi:hypothetical protein
MSLDGVRWLNHLDLKLGIEGFWDGCFKGTVSAVFAIGESQFMYE